MITYKCENCGGQMEFGGSGGFVCPYCGSKAFFTDRDFRESEEFRKKLLQYYKAEADKKDFDYRTDFLWTPSAQDRFTLENGQSLYIDYMKKYLMDGAACYIAKESVVYIFDSAKGSADFMAGVKRLRFPAADTRLHRSFPELKMELSLRAGKQALAFRRRPLVYPAEIFAPWEPQHLAWVISRMENICCTLEYAGIEHRGITPDSVWVNPVSHEGMLFGDWRKVRTLLYPQRSADLSALRRTAVRLAKNTREPAELYAFLTTAPDSDAFTDFKRWDKVIEAGFGGHKFVKMDL